MNPKTVWIGVAVAAVTTVVLISNLFQPSGLKLDYDPQSYFEVRRLFFAAGVLAVLALMLLISVAIYATSTSSNQAPGKDIFDSMIKVVPPIITLVLGYYFGQQSAVRGAEKAITATEQGAHQKRETPDSKAPLMSSDQKDQGATKLAPSKSFPIPAAPSAPTSNFPAPAASR